MEAVRTLIENYWIVKEKNKDLYLRVRRELAKCQKFFREQLGWTVINNERILKIEKIPAHAESFMGVTEFTEIKDYCMFCAVLIFLEDKEDQEQFLLSELVDMLELQLKGITEADWTMFTHRKSLVRVLQFCEAMGLIEVYEGNSESIGGGMGAEILYENTGLSRYMAVNFSYSISDFQSWRDFEEQTDETDRGHYRINRVYRQLTAAPALYWSQPDDQDSIYLKNQRQWVQKNLNDYLGGQLHIQKNTAFFMMEEERCFGQRHPREAMLPELVLLFCGRIREKVKDGAWQKKPDESIRITREQFRAELHSCRSRYRAAWSKEYREMEEEKLLNTVIAYMKEWLMLEAAETEITIYPTAGKLIGSYPADFRLEENNE